MDDDPAPVVSELEERNALALAIVPVSGIQLYHHMTLLICLYLVPVFLVNL